jgi:Flp pilus assembly protein TadB
MLSDYERRILDELEVELRRHRSRRSAAVHGSRLPVAALGLAAAIYLSVVAALAPLVASPLIAVLGVLVGWLLVNVVRRRFLGPGARRRLRRARRQQEIDRGRRRV